MEQHLRSSRKSSSSHPDPALVHCLVCGDLILKREILEESFEDVDCIGGGTFMALFKLFEIKLNKKSTGLWNDKEESPFCAVCQNQVVQLIQLWKQLDEIKQVLDEGKRMLKDKLESSEVTFESIGIYQRDGRYLQARDLILERRDEPSSQRGRKPSKSNLPSRQAVRRDPKKVKINDDLIPGVNPQVSLSAKDKKAAEEYASLINMKSEITKRDVPEELLVSPMINDDDLYIAPVATLSDHWDNSSDEDSTIKRIINNPRQPDNRASKVQKKKRKKVSNSDNDEDWEPSKELKEKRKKSSVQNSSDAPPASADIQLSSESEDSSDDEKLDGFGKCLKFDKKTGSGTYLNVTMDKVDNDEYKCRKCGEFLPNSKKILRYHIIREHTNLTTCKQCGKKFDIQSRLIAHIKHIHEGGRAREHPLLECSICGRLVRMRVKLVLHQWSHYNAQEKLDAIARGEKDPTIPKRTVQCDVCGYECKNNQNLRNHKKIHHPDSTREKKICPKCGTQVLYLESHLKRHEDDGAELWFQCALCSKGFPSRRKLNCHKRFHELPFKCTMCDRGFPKKELLQEHVNLHMGIRPHQCPHCEATFSSKMCLNKHVKSFHGEGAPPRRKFYQRGLTRKASEGLLGAVVASEQVTSLNLTL